MKRFQVKTGLIFASWALLLAFGCPKKKPPIPPQEQPPTISAVEQHPQEESQPQNPPAQNPQPAQEPEQATNKPPEKTTPPKHSKPRPIKKAPSEGDKNPVEIAKSTPPEPPVPPRVVIQEQSGQSGANSPGTDQATTQQLLDSTENNLRNIKRQLSTNEQSMLDQIKDYIKQSQKATKDGDQVGAYKLALKAHLLSDELAKNH